MKLKSFRWCLSIETTANIKLRTREVQFGDGYIQRAGDGINTKSLDLNGSYTGVNEEIRKIIDFIDEHKGYIPFVYIHPFLGESIYVCEEYSIRTDAKNISTISMNLKHSGA